MISHDADRNRKRSEVTIATVQPPGTETAMAPVDIMDRAVAYLEEAAKSGADVICLPEYLNCMNVGPEEAKPYVTVYARDLRQRVKEIATRFGCYVILPMLIEEDGERYNRSEIFDRVGQAVGHFDKVHIPETERTAFYVKESDDWPIFDCDFGRIGIMTCYDGCFVEAARTLAVKGAQIIFWPSLQRGYTESELDLQTRAHAFFNRVVIVRSSFGTDVDKPWKPGMMVGLSCVCNAEGIIQACLGRRTGWISAKINLEHPATCESMFGGQIGNCRNIHFGDRRPETYSTLLQKSNKQEEEII